jgi:hypothetical protein
MARRREHGPPAEQPGGRSYRTVEGTTIGAKGSATDAAQPRFCWHGCVRPALDDALTTGCATRARNGEVVVPDVVVIEHAANNCDVTAVPGYPVVDDWGQRTAYVVVDGPLAACGSGGAS